MNAPATCAERVRRDTGYATPVSPRTVVGRCGRPTTHVVVDADGTDPTVYAWSCAAHRGHLDALVADTGLRVVAVDPDDV